MGESTNIASVVQDVRRAHQSGRTQSYEWRMQQLAGLLRFLKEQETQIQEALHKDLGKPRLEAFSAEIAFTASEVKLTRKNLATWMKPKKVNVPLVLQPAKAYLYPESLGVILIIGPWNYPFQLIAGPLLGAIAGGNCAIIKPSEVAKNTSALIANMLPKYIDPLCFKVVEGGVEETTALLEEKFDHIFYTGNGAVARIVMAAAAKHLTPLTLELGGKSPCIVDQDVDLSIAAKRILWGKFYNAGQTCVAPDYILAHANIYDALISQLKSTLLDFYGTNPKTNPDYGRIINERHHKRLCNLLSSGKTITDPAPDEATRYIAPTLMVDVPLDSPVMQEEIFGPILPIIKVNSIDEAIAFINSRPKPLAEYVFSTNEHVHHQVISRTSSGAVTINHVWLHLAVPEIPFGGIGESGMGAYHGKHTFNTFTHLKPVLSKPTMMEPPLVYPPYTETKEKWIRRLL